MNSRSLRGRGPKDTALFLFPLWSNMRTKSDVSPFKSACCRNLFGLKSKKPAQVPYNAELHHENWIPQFTVSGAVEYVLCLKEFWERKGYLLTATSSLNLLFTVNSTKGTPKHDRKSGKKETYGAAGPHCRLECPFWEMMTYFCLKRC